MDKEEAIQSVKDMCERHKQNHQHYPTTVQVRGEVWQALAEPGYLFPPHAEPSVIVSLMDMGGIFSPELDPLAPIPVVKVIPRLPDLSEPREYTDEQTGIRLTVEEGAISQYPQVTVFPPEGCTLEREEFNEAIRRLLDQAGMKPEEQQ